MTRLLAVAAALVLCLGALGQRPAVNYDEAKVPKYSLPDPLVMQNGERVPDAKTWQERRRPEILELYRSEVFGRSPARPAEVNFEIASSEKALGGRAVRKRVTVWLAGRDGPKMDLLLYLPAGAKKPSPVFLGLGFAGNQSVYTDPAIPLAEEWTRDPATNAVVKRWAEEILTPKVDWRAALRGAVRGAIGRAAGTEDYSFHRPARRSAAVRVILPSLVKPVPRVALTIDTSGSMGSKQLEQAIGEVKGVLRTVGQPIEVMSVDMEVHTKQRVGRASQVKLEGGGGTDMGVGLVAACALKPKPDVVVVLTDGQTGWPETQPNGIRVVIALLCDKGNVPPTPDWARTVVAEVAGA